MEHRSISVEATWQNIRPYLAERGITRVGDITGLDRIGIPVWIAVRPNSRALSVAQGKGETAARARVAAAMEAIESSHAECPNLPLNLDTYEGLVRRSQVVDVGALPQVRDSLFGTRQPMFWCQASEWSTGDRIWVPYEAVYADTTVPRLEGSGAFLTSTNGLAAGNSFEEAATHALYELVERDALALFRLWSEAERHAGRVIVSTVTSRRTRDIIDHLLALGIIPMIWDCTSDVGIPTYRVILFDETASATSALHAAAFGSGCNLDREEALWSALLEAAQSRLTAIAGARDDLSRDRYASAALTMRSFRAMAQENGALSFDDLANIRDYDQPIDTICRALRKIGIGSVLSVQLSPPDRPYAVVKMLAPGLEGADDSPSYLPGARAMSRLRGHSA